MDRITRLTYPDGEVLATTYNQRGLPATLTSTPAGGSPQVLANNAQYDDAGNLTYVNLPAGQANRFQTFSGWTAVAPNFPNALQNLWEGLPAGKGGGTFLAYQYDVVGDVTGLTDGTPPLGIDHATPTWPMANFSYDALHRLTSAYQQNYSYDALGRLTQFGQSSNNSAVNYCLDPNHEHAVGGANHTVRYVYDADGNLIIRNAGQSNAESLVWDALNHLLEIDGTPGGDEYFVYDANGQKAAMGTLSGGDQNLDYGYTYYLGNDYEVSNPQGSGEVPIKYYSFGGLLIAMRKGSALYYLHADYLGSTLAATDSSGNLASSQARYEAYGNDLYGTAAYLPTDRDFTGQKLDGTGFYQMGARWYDP